MTRRYGYIATKSDLTPGIRAFEAKTPLKYVLDDWRRTPELEVYHSALDIPDFGVSPRGISEDGNFRYVVIGAKYDFMVRDIPQKDGDCYYEPLVPHVPHLLYTPGGLYKDDCLVAGIIYDATTIPGTLSFYRRFTYALTKGFVPLQGRWRKYLVGPEAMELARSGVRLITRFADEPREYDIQISALEDHTGKF